MISYLQAVRELDARWTSSLQFLPPTPRLRNEHDCIVARHIAVTEIDLFNRYAGEIAAANGLKLDRLLDLYDWLLLTGKLSALDGDDPRMDGGQRPAGCGIASPSASQPSRPKPKLQGTHQDRE